jgi:uncharacterized SAM-binding protein YcdF (DUF218 family)
MSRKLLILFLLTKIIPALRAAACALGLLHFLISFTPVLSWSVRFFAGPWNDSAGRTLIVLAGSEIDGEFLGRSSFWRAVSATRAWREGGFDRIIISGGTLEDGLSIAARMKLYMTGVGVPAEVIDLEERSLTTRENALAVAATLAGTPRPLVLMTSDDHMYRAIRTFRACGINALPRPIPDAGKQLVRWPERWSVFLRLTEEAVKIVYYRWNGWLG